MNIFCENLPTLQNISNLELTSVNGLTFQRSNNFEVANVTFTIYEIVI